MCVTGIFVLVGIWRKERRQGRREFDMGVKRKAAFAVSGGSGKNALHWFRLGLRLHDNPALVKAVCEAQKENSALYLIFIIDRVRFDLPSSSASPTRMSGNRHRFLHDCLHDLDRNLRAKGSRLFIAHGEPLDVLERLIEQWKIGLLTYEVDIAPYSVERDRKVREMAERLGVKIDALHSKTLFNLDDLLAANKGKVPMTYNGFQNVIAKLGSVPKPVSLPEGAFPQPDMSLVSDKDGKDTIDSNEYVDGIQLKFPGGETEALSRLDRSLSDAAWVANFEKPKTSPNSLEASTTVLSPYFSMGCLSPRLFWHRVDEIYRRRKSHSKPPVSLHGQMIFREYFHTSGYATANFGRMKGNALCKQIPWGEDDELLASWAEGRTGFPFIDAIMTQLREEGWIHHLARHAVACFLTRGDLWQSWEKGAAVFERHLLDGDWSMNVSNWLWLSASGFFYQYFRVYSPVAFGKKVSSDIVPC